MRSEDIGLRLKDFLLSQGVPCDVGVSEDRIAEFEHRHNVQMPADLRYYFLVMNGCSVGGYGFGIIRFWNLEEFKSVADEIRNTRPTAAVIQSAYREPPEGAEHYFVFADVMYEIQLYAIHLSSSQDGQNQVIVLDGSDPIKVADSFSQFIDLYITSPERLRLIVD